jgi:hypothetical protein
MPSLYLNENKRFLVRILHPVRSAHSDIDCLARFDRDVAIIEGNFCPSLDHHPVFGALRVFLIAQTLAGQHFDPFDFKTVSFIEHSKCSPRSAIKSW